MRPPRLGRFLLAALVAAASTGCVWTSSPPPFYGYPGNIYLSWSFSGASCAQTAAVASVTVTIPNDPVPIVPNVFPCSAGDPPGALAIYNFNPGSYTVTATAQDVNGTVIFTGSTTVVVNGDVYATVNLAPSGSGNGVAYLSWVFDAPVGTYYPPCTASTSTDPDRMDAVALYVDGANTVAQIYDCAAGSGTAQVTTPNLTPGTHTVQLVAYQQGVADGFAQTDPVQVTVVANNPTAQTLSFHWMVGGVGVAWTYPSGAMNCASNGVASVTVSFGGTGGYDTSGNACATAVVPFKRLPATAAVTYPLSVAAYGSPPAAPLYSGSVPAVTIRPGYFYDGTTATLVTVPLN
jgi:hypothetical protein